MLSTAHKRFSSMAATLVCMRGKEGQSKGGSKGIRGTGRKDKRQDEESKVIKKGTKGVELSRILPSA